MKFEVDCEEGSVPYWLRRFAEILSTKGERMTNLKIEIIIDP